MIELQSKLKNLLKNRCGINRKLISYGLMDDVINSTKFLDIVYSSVSLSQRLWHIANICEDIKYCEICHTNPTRFRASYNRYNHTCSEDCEKLKRRNTCLKKYNSTAAISSTSCREKSSATNLEKYGEEKYLKSEDYKNKSRHTNIKKYGREYYIASDIAKKRYRNWALKTYGVDNFFHSSEFERMRLMNYEEYILDQIEGYELISSPIDFITLEHKKCGKQFTESKKFIHQRKRYGHEICTNCLPKNHRLSIPEQQVKEFIRDIYHGTILENCRGVIRNKEIDIYMPELKIGIEFNGDFFHANPKKYKPDDKIFYTSASDIWKRDADKNKQLKELGIRILYVWESDWVKNKEETKKAIQCHFKTNY